MMTTNDELKVTLDDLIKLLDRSTYTNGQLTGEENVGFNLGGKERIIDEETPINDERVDILLSLAIREFGLSGLRGEEWLAALNRIPSEQELSQELRGVYLRFVEYDLLH